MRPARLAGLILVALLAMSIAAASTTAATLPTFNPGTANTFTGASGPGVLTANNGTEEIDCASDTSTGEITNTMNVGDVFVHFFGCTSTGTGGSGCATQNEGFPATSNLIITNELHGILGLILPKPASGSDVGLLLLPHVGKIFVDVAPNACIKGGDITGQVAGEVGPVGVSQKDGTVTFSKTGTEQSIKDLDTLYGLIKPKLTAFSTPATEETSELINFNTAVEIT